MLLLSWNVAGRVKRLPEQGERLLERDADVVCLQEVTRSTLPQWQSLLHEAGYLGLEHGELALIRGLEPYGYRDAFRLLHPEATDEISWDWPRWSGGYRLDHLIVSGDLALEDCHFEHAWREEGLPDHSALVGRLRLRS